jgi:hypothetical protein
MKCKTLIVILLSTLEFAHSQQLRRFAGKQALDAEVQIAPSEFTERHVLDLCRAFMAANSDYTVIRYLVVTDRVDAEKLIGPPADFDFSAWLYLYKKESPLPPPTAELIKLGDKAVVRLKLANGANSERVIGAGSPLTIDFQGESAKILEVKPIPPGKRGESNYSGGVEFYVQTPAPWTRRLAEDFVKHIQATTGLDNVAIEVEDGPWFVGAGYPVYNRFLPYTQPPGFEEFKKYTRFYCESPSGGCLQTGPAEP